MPNSAWLWGLAAAKRKAEGKTAAKKPKKPKREVVETKEEGQDDAGEHVQDPLSKSWIVSFMKLVLFFLTCLQEWDDADDEPYGDQEPQSIWGTYIYIYILYWLANEGLCSVLGIAALSGKTLTISSIKLMVLDTSLVPVLYSNDIYRNHIPAISRTNTQYIDLHTLLTLQTCPNIYCGVIHRLWGATGFDDQQLNPAVVRINAKNVSVCLCPRWELYMPWLATNNIGNLPEPLAFWVRRDALWEF